MDAYSYLLPRLSHCILIEFVFDLEPLMNLDIFSEFSTLLDWIDSVDFINYKFLSNTESALRSYV